MRAPSELAPFTGAVLTGGRSARMGIDKPLIDLGGRPMASYALATLAQAGASPVLAIGGPPATLVALAKVGFATIEEAEPGRGPLAGIITALEASPQEMVVIVACDLPLVSAAAITALRRATGSGPGAVARVAGRVQPLLGAYRRQLAPALIAALASNGAVHRALAGLGLVEVDLDQELVGPNVNTAADLVALSDRLGHR